MHSKQLAKGILTYRPLQHDARPPLNITQQMVDIVEEQDEEQRLQLALSAFENALPQDTHDYVMCAYESVNLADDDRLMEDLIIQELVHMVTGGGGDENGDDEKEVDVEKPLIPSTVALRYLHEMSRYFSNNHVLQKHVNALQDIAQAVYQRQAELSK